MKQPDQEASRAALGWLNKRHAGDWNATNEAEFQSWLQQAPAHREAWQQADTLWSKLGGLHALAGGELARARRSRSLWPRRIAWSGLALTSAATLLVLPPGSFAPAQEIATRIGEMRHVDLPDGSTLTLDSGSRVRINYGLVCRCLDLQRGALTVAVRHGDWRHFDVTVGEDRVRDVGTRFVIRRDDRHTTVGVLEGAVEYQAVAAAPLLLQAGEVASRDTGGRPLLARDTRVADLAAWQDGSLVFRDTPLSAVLSEFARYHPLRIEVDHRLDAFHLSGRFATGDLDGLLKLLQDAYPLRVEHPASDRLRLVWRP
jgi:transmembrane sensor